MSAERVLQAAVVTALKADAAYVALVAGGVHDGDAPHGTEYPYTVLGSTTEVPDHTHDHNGYELTLTLHDWSAYEGKKECQQIREARNDVLHRAILTVAGWGLTQLQYEFGDVGTEFDAESQKNLRHQVTRYRASALEA
jgi:hypothetical protein